MKRLEYLIRRAIEMGIPPLMAREAVFSTALAHPKGWLDEEVDEGEEDNE